MAKINVVNFEGANAGEIELNDSLFSMEPNEKAIYDAIIMQQASLRQGTHATKTRGMVRGGGRKPFRQKGTGRARQGSIRSPQWRGGGTVFGPNPRNYSYKINRKVRKLALKSAIIQKYNEGSLIVVDSINIDKPHTKAIVNFFNSIEATRKPLLTTKEYNESIFLSTRNVPGALNLDVSGLNVLDVVSAHKLIMTKDALKQFQEVFA